MLAPIIPWEPCTFPDSIKRELDRRKVNRSFNFVDANQAGWDTDTNGDGDWTKYRGPMIPWIRFCSNGVGREWEKKLDSDGNKVPLKTGIKEGFVFFGGQNFYDTYGFAKNASGIFEGVIGFLPDGVTTHVIENDINTSDYPIHVPAPQIEKITVTIQKELYRRASVEWVCFSKAQLEYMTPYFMVPGISCTLEWGWNHFNTSCLIDLTNVKQLKEFNNNPYPLYTDHILPSKGNYDVLLGRITHFEWTVEGNKFKCKTEITSQDRIYAGLVVDATAVNKIDGANGVEQDIKPFGNLLDFIEKKLPLFQSVGNVSDPLTIDQLSDFIRYLQKHFPINFSNSTGSTWKDYLYGIFYGRDMLDHKNPPPGANKEKDFDCVSYNRQTWLNLGLVFEILNFHVEKIKSFKQAEIFRIDIDDVVINGHPNLISNDGGVLLIPNAEAPKYFSGKYGHYGLISSNKESAENYKKLIDEFSILKNVTGKIVPITDYNSAKKSNKLPDYRLAKVCGQSGAYRDNLDELINRVRYQNNRHTNSYYAFPFISDKSANVGSKPYPARYSGNLKDLYVNVDFLKQIVGDTSIKTYVNLIEKLISGISAAAGGFWDFRMVSGTGRANQPSGTPATMKIVDYKFSNTINIGSPYSFDYADVDSLLMGIGFKPTLSNAQAIRTIYAQTNQPDKNIVVTNGDNELLDYHFRDRLAKDDDIKSSSPPPSSDNQFAEIMKQLQQINPPSDSYQMTSKKDGKTYICRLALPNNNSEVLKLLLDDGDEEHNPKYTGIMPGIQATFTIDGIGGLRTFMMFLVRNLPEPYSSDNIIFRIVDVTEAIDSGKWITTITAGVIPLRPNIKARLGISTSKTN